MSFQATPPEERVHPMHRFVGELLAGMDALGTPPTWSMTADELAETMTECATAVARLQGLSLGVVAQADYCDLATERGAVNAAGLVRGLTRMSGPAATRAVKTARALEKHPLTQDALREGGLDLDQARVILDAVDALPASVGPEDRDKAEAHLVALAADHDAIALRKLGEHLLEVIDPDAADQALAAKLEKQERDAARKTYLTTRDCGDGTSEGRFRIPILHRALLNRYLQALMNPARPDPIDPEGRTRAEIRGEAFCQLLERYPVDKLPTCGGVAATVVVTIPLDTLLGGLKAACLDTGDLISPSLARRLACEAGIIPAVLGTDSEVLDLGRTARHHTKKQRLAMNLQQHGSCAVEHCERPAWWCDGHHLTPWAEQGETTVTDGVLICPRHHTLAHQAHLQVHRTGPGTIRIVRRQ